MIKTRLSALGAVLLVALTGLSSHAASSAGALRVTARATSEVELFLTRPAVLDQARTSVVGSGSFGGWAIIRPGAGGDMIAAELRVKRWTAGSGALRVATRTATPIRLGAGRYRLIVFADQPTAVTIPLRSGRSMSLTAARRTTARAQLRNLLDPAPVVVAPQNRVTLRYPGAFVLSQIYFRSRAHQAEAEAQCFAPASQHVQTCANATGSVWALPTPGSVGDGYSSAFAAAYGRELPAGDEVDVLLQAADLDAPSFAEWLTVTA